MKAEYVMLAHKYKKQDIIGWLASEKLDGMRAIWDGGISRGKDSLTVPWANNTKSSGIATGLWSRGGKIIYAPDSWLDRLPGCMLDGELYLGRGQFQTLMSIVKRHEPGPEWNDVRYEVFDVPSAEFFKPRTIKNPTHDFSVGHCNIKGSSYKTFSDTLGWMDKAGIEHVRQSPIGSLDDLKKWTDQIMSLGGEGVILRNPDSIWTPQRSRNLLKHKPEHDAEGIVIGAVAGKGKLKGMMGALIVSYGNVTFQLSGFTNAERELTEGGARLADTHPGEELHSSFCTCFQYGDTITFRYRELSDMGVPKEAKYWRKGT